MQYCTVQYVTGNRHFKNGDSSISVILIFFQIFILSFSHFYLVDIKITIVTLTKNSTYVRDNVSTYVLTNKNYISIIIITLFDKKNGNHINQKKKKNWQKLCKQIRELFFFDFTTTT